MSDTSVTTTSTTPDPEAIITQFESLVVDIPTDGQPRPHGPLWYAWHYLQVYSFWGLHLANTEAQLKLVLGVTDPGGYAFFPSMLESYQTIYHASENFLNNVFPKVVELGNDLSQFATQATSKTTDGGGMFSVITDFLDGKDGGTTDDAIQLLNELEKSATDNAAKAGAVGGLLAIYKTSLVDAQGKLANVQTQIESDSNTSQAKIDELNSTVPGAAGSLATLKSLVSTDEDAYNHDVVVAATSPTYVWVFPIGTIAAVVVAATFTAFALEQLDALNKAKDAVAAAESSLHTAYQSRAVQNVALTGVNSAVKHTDLAIDHTATVQNAWTGLTTQLGVIKDQIGKMTTEKDENKALQSNALIKVYLRAADAAWGKIAPPLQELTAEPYISIQSGEVTLTDFMADVQKAIAAKN